MKVGASTVRLSVATAIAMMAFAANSVLTRAALDGGHADPWWFSVVRASSGAALLVLIVAWRRQPGARAQAWHAGSWRASAALTLYLVAFTAAYVYLGAGTGALLLFGAVQATIFGAAVRRRDAIAGRTWTGLVVALVGLVVLLAPSAEAPGPWASAAMVLAGVAWGVYSLQGRGTVDAVGATAANFVRAVPLILVIGIAGWVALPSPGDVGATSPPDAIGWMLALASGALASGIGYAAWYSVLPSLSRTTAGLVQLTPIPIAAGAALLLIDEELTLRFVAASLLILGGTALGVIQRVEDRRDRSGMRGLLGSN